MFGLAPIRNKLEGKSRKRQRTKGSNKRNQVPPWVAYYVSSWYSRGYGVNIFTRIESAVVWFKSAPRFSSIFVHHTFIDFGAKFPKVVVTFVLLTRRRERGTKSRDN